MGKITVSGDVTLIVKAVFLVFLFIHSMHTALLEIHHGCQTSFQIFVNGQDALDKK